MKLIYLIGIPGTGKSTVMKEFMKHIGSFEQEKITKQLWVEKHTDEWKDIRVLGKYDEGETFCGTDRLSMSIVPEAVEFVKEHKVEFPYNNQVWFGEGDRLNNKAFFEAFGDDLKIVYLEVSDKERERRYKERGSNQSEKFIQTCKTKVGNIVEWFGPKATLFGEEMGCVHTFTHETPEDTKKIVNFLLKELEK